MFMPKIRKIAQYLRKLQLEVLGIFFWRHGVDEPAAAAATDEVVV